MAAEKRGLFHVFRMSRKLALLSGVFLLVLGASGTAALVLAPAHLLPGYSEETVSSCKTLYQSEFRRGREERLIAVISTDAVKPADRVRIGMRLARHLVETSKPDLVIVQVVDHKGPTGRAEIRGPVVGAEIAHAPNPSKTHATGKPWEARYIDALPTSGGLYFGPRVDMRLADLQTIDNDFELIEGCDGDLVDEEAQAVSEKSSGH